MIDRIMKSILVFSLAGMSVACGGLFTAAVAKTAGNTSPTMPVSYMLLFWCVSAVVGGGTAALLACLGDL